MQLDDVRVLDLSRLLPGPYATQLLADLGADVIKVEDPARGDYARTLPPTTDDGVGAVFAAVNRGKRSVTIDLKSGDGRDVFYRLLETADVVVEGFRPGVVDRLGVDYESVLDRAPEVVYCSISGWGQEGPYRDRVGHDLTYAAAAGLLDMTRESADELPRIPGYPIADMAGGLTAAYGILGGLLSRELGDGTGEYVDVSLTDALVSFSQVVTLPALSGEDPRPGETPLTGALPWYDVYETADGGAVALAALEARFWSSFCDLVDRPELASAHGTTDPAEREALRAELADLFAERTRAEWRDAATSEVPLEPVSSPAEAVAHPQIDARGLIERETPPGIESPVRSSAPTGDRAVPDHGEHTESVLAGCGFDAAEIDRLREDGTC